MIDSSPTHRDRPPFSFPTDPTTDPTPTKVDPLIDPHTDPRPPHFRDPISTTIAVAPPSIAPPSVDLKTRSSGLTTTNMTPSTHDPTSVPVLAVPIPRPSMILDLWLSVVTVWGLLHVSVCLAQEYWLHRFSLLQLYALNKASLSTLTEQSTQTPLSGIIWQRHQM